MPRKGTGKGTKRAGAKKTEAEPTMELTVPAVALTKQLAELMRWREIEWARIPALTRKLTMPYLTARDTIKLDIAVSDKEERKHLVKAYIGLRSRGLDRYAHYRVSHDGKCLGVAWVQKRSIDLRNFCLEYKDFKRFKKYQGQVLALLVHDEHQELATYFVTRCDVRDADYRGLSTLSLASVKGYLEIVQALLGREGTNVNKGGGNYGFTALHWAATNGYIEVARALLQAGANARKSTHLGTPLHAASREAHIEIVRALLEAGAGADVRKPNGYGMTPISLACNRKHFEVFRALVEAGGDVNELNSGGRTALHHASRSGFTEGVRYLCVERGADVNKITANGFGDTPLTLVSENGKVEAVRVLLEAGADVNKRSSGGETPLSLALTMHHWDEEQVEQGKPKVAALLREAGAQEPTADELEEIEQQNAESEEESEGDY